MNSLRGHLFGAQQDYREFGASIGGNALCIDLLELGMDAYLLESKRIFPYHLLDHILLSKSNNIQFHPASSGRARAALV